MHLFATTTGAQLVEMGKRAGAVDLEYANRGELKSRGLYLDSPPWQASVFAMTRRS